MDPTLLKKLADVFGPLGAQIGAQMSPVYGPAMARFTIQELMALNTLIQGKKAIEAQDALRAKMTVEELAAEKAGPLLELSRQMAVDQNAKWNFAEQVLLIGLQVLLAALVGL